MEIVAVLGVWVIMSMAIGLGVGAMLTMCSNPDHAVRAGDDVIVTR